LNNIPAHIFWSINDIPYSTVKQEQSVNFKYHLNLQDDTFFSFKQENANRLKQIYEQVNKPLAICLSGRDSEMIYRECKAQGIPCKAFFLRMWDLNNHDVEILQSIVREFDDQLEIIDLNLKDFVAFTKDCFIQTLCSSTHYLTLPYLFTKIPTDYYIIVGEGDFKKPTYRYEIKPLPGQVPYSWSEVSFRVWADINNINGEFYYWSSSLKLILATLHDNRYNYKDSENSTSNIETYWYPELKFTSKTNNWAKNPIYFKTIRSMVLVSAPSWYSPTIECIADYRQYLAEKGLLKGE